MKWLLIDSIDIALPEETKCGARCYRALVVDTFRPLLWQHVAAVLVRLHRCNVSRMIIVSVQHMVLMRMKPHTLLNAYKRGKPGTPTRRFFGQRGRDHRNVKGHRWQHRHQFSNATSVAQRVVWLNYQPRGDNQVAHHKWSPWQALRIRISDIRICHICLTDR